MSVTAGYPVSAAPKMTAIVTLAKPAEIRFVWMACSLAQVLQTAGASGPWQGDLALIYRVILGMGLGLLMHGACLSRKTLLINTQCVAGTDLRIEF